MTFEMRLTINIHLHTQKRDDIRDAYRGKQAPPPRRGDVVRGGGNGRDNRNGGGGGGRAIVDVRALAHMRPQQAQQKFERRAGVIRDVRDGKLDRGSSPALHQFNRLWRNIGEFSFLFSFFLCFFVFLFLLLFFAVFRMYVPVSHHRRCINSTDCGVTSVSLLLIIPRRFVLFLLLLFSVFQSNSCIF
jgi:hypothetical protein